MKLIALLCLLLVVGIGWGSNIYKFCKCDFQPSYKVEIIRGIGVFVVPIGVVVGYM